MKIDREFIEAKLYLVQQYYQELIEILKHSDEQIKGNKTLLRAIERLIQFEYSGGIK